MTGMVDRCKDERNKPKRAAGQDEPLEIREKTLMKMFSTPFWLMTIFIVSSSVWAGTATSAALKETANTPSFQPKDGMVPNAKTAIAIAIAVWNPVYGEKQIQSQKPYNAVLRNGRWVVTGSLPNT